MPLYEIALRQAREINGVGLYKWSNTVHMNAASAAVAAAAAAVAWGDVLRFGYRDDVYCYEAYATDVLAPNASPTPGTSDFAVVGVPASSQRGALASGSLGDAYWKDVCLNIELRVFSSRPDRKYIRPGLREADFNGNGQFANPTFVQAIESNWNSFVSELNLLSGDGEIIQAAIITKAGIRRLGRESAFDVPPPPPEG